MGPKGCYGSMQALLGKTMKLKDWRKKKRLSQSEVADLLGVTDRAVCAWERGDWPPTPPHARKIIEVTGGEVGYEDLYGAPEPAADAA